VLVEQDACAMHSLPLQVNPPQQSLADRQLAFWAPHVALQVLFTQ
jgi:hypothetical protein